MAERSYRGLLWSLALLGLILDQATKYSVFRWLYADAVQNHRSFGEFDLVPGVFKLLAQFTREPAPTEGFGALLKGWSSEVLPKVNHGALFGLGSDYIYLANGFFAVISILAALAIIYWSSRPSTARDPFLSAALGLILAGTLGNLYDRLIFHGVRDFLYFYWIEWPVFNVADCCLVGGAFLLLAQAFFASPALTEEAAMNAPGLTPSPEVVEAKG